MFELIVVGAVVTVVVCIYFLPALIAARNGHSHPGAVFALNLLLGWTFLGWAGALVWALVTPPRTTGPR